MPGFGSVEVALCYRRIQLRAKSQRPHAKNCTDMEDFSAGGKIHFCLVFEANAMLSSVWFCRELAQKKQLI